MNLYLITNLVTGDMHVRKSDLPEDFFCQSLIEGVEGRHITKQISLVGWENIWVQLLLSGNIQEVEDRLHLISLLLAKPIDGRGSLLHRQRISAQWSPERRAKQAEIAKRTHETTKNKLRDYTCPTCKEDFGQVTSGVYSGHRKACLHWAKVTQRLEEEMGTALDEILD